MNDTFMLELADSELAGAEVQGDSLVLRLSAALVQHSGSLDHGYVQHVALWCRQAHWQGPIDQAFGRIRAAHTRLDGAPLRLIAPGRITGAAVLTLRLAFDDELTVHTRSIDVRFDGPPGFRASLAC